MTSRAIDCYSTYVARINAQLDDYMQRHSQAYPYPAVQQALAPNDYGIFKEAASLRPAAIPSDYNASSVLWIYIQHATLPERLTQIIAGLSRYYADYQQTATETDATFKRFYPTD